MVTYKDIQIKKLNIECEATKIQALEKILDKLNNIHEIAKEYNLEIDIDSFIAYNSSDSFVGEVNLKDYDKE